MCVLGKAGDAQGEYSALTEAGINCVTPDISVRPWNLASGALTLTAAQDQGKLPPWGQPTNHAALGGFGPKCTAMNRRYYPSLCMVLSVAVRLTSSC